MASQVSRGELLRLYGLRRRKSNRARQLAFERMEARTLLSSNLLSGGVNYALYGFDQGMSRLPRAVAVGDLVRGESRPAVVVGVVSGNAGLVVLPNQGDGTLGAPMVSAPNA